MTRATHAGARPKRFVAAGALALTVALPLTACGSSSNGGGASSGPSASTSTSSGSAPGGSGTLVIGTPSAADSINPAKANDTTPNQVLLQLAYEPLLKQDSKGYSPGLATKWGYVGKGNRTFSMTLRHDARFSDGTPVTADAVKDWIDYFNKTSPIVAYFLPGLKSVTTSGKWTVVVHLGSPDSQLEESFWALAGFVTSPKAIAKPGSLSTSTDGAGPYVYDASASVSGSSYVFTPNKYYYDKSAIHFQKVEIKVVSSAATMLQAAQTGQVNVALGDPTTASSAQSAGFTIAKAPSVTFGIPYLANRTSKSPLGNLKVRQALNYAINRPAIAKALGGQFAGPTSQIITSTTGGSSYKNYYPYNPTKAKALLKAAGYPNGFSLKINVDGTQGNYGTQLAQTMAQDLENVGVSLKLTTQASEPAWGTAASGTSFDGSEGAIGVLSTPFLYNVVFFPKAALNPFKVSDPEMDKLFAEGSVSSDPDAYWKKMSLRMVSQADALPVLFADSLWYVGKGYTGVVPTALNSGTIDPTAITAG